MRDSVKEHFCFFIFKSPLGAPVLPCLISWFLQEPITSCRSHHPRPFVPIYHWVGRALEVHPHPITNSVISRHQTALRNIWALNPSVHQVPDPEVEGALRSLLRKLPLCRPVGRATNCLYDLVRRSICQATQDSGIHRGTWELR